MQEIILIGGPEHGRVVAKPPVEPPRLGPKPRELSEEEKRRIGWSEVTYLASGDFDEEGREFYVWSDERGPLRNAADDPG